MLLPLLTGLNRLKAPGLLEAALRLAELAEAPLSLTTLLGPALLEVAPPLPTAEAIEGLGLLPLPGLPLAISGRGPLRLLGPGLLRRLNRLRATPGTPGLGLGGTTCEQHSSKQQGGAPAMTRRVREGAGQGG